MPTMEWNVKNALNRDVERQHLNKILADIATSIASVSKTSGGSATGNVKDIVGEMVESNSESGISVTYDFVNKVLNFAVSSFTLRLAGDVTGQVSLSPGGGAVMTTTLDPSKIGIPDTTNDGYAYWRRYGVWEAVGSNLEAIQVLAADGFPACNYDPTTETATWTMRTIAAGAGITVTDGDGVAGNPTIAHADTSSVANLTSDNSNLVVVQDVTFTFDTYGHVQTAVVGTVDLGTSLITQTITNGDTTHAPSGDAVFDALALKEPVITAGTDAQMWRGDKTFTNWINGDWRVGGSSGLFGSGRELVVTAGTAGDNIGHVSLQGSRTTNGTFGTVNYYHKTDRVAAIAGYRDGADDAGGFQIVTKATGAGTAVAIQVGGDRHWLPGADAVQNIGSSSKRMSTIYGMDGEFTTAVNVGGNAVAINNQVLHTTGNETASGVKTFSSSVVLGSINNSISFSPTLRVEYEDTTAVASGTFIRYGANTASSFVLGYKARGTAAAPTQALSGDGLFAIRAGGWHSGGAFGTTQAAEIVLSAAEDFTSTAQGTKARIRVSPTGSASATDRLTVDSNGDTFLTGGRLYGTALHNHASGLTGTTNQYVGSGTYTPTFTNVANLDSTTASAAQWMRVGNVVTVSGQAVIDATTTSTVTQLRISLPIASNIAAAQNCTGAASCLTQGARILGDTVNDAALLQFTAVSVASDTWGYTFQYVIL